MFKSIKPQFILYKDSNFLRDIQIFVIENASKQKILEAFFYVGEGTLKEYISFYVTEHFVLFSRNISFCGLYSLWGHIGQDWKYQLQFLAGLNALSFNRDNWIKKGASSAFEFEPANKYAVALRIDNYSIPGLRLGISGYYGHSIDNSLGRDANGTAAKLKGAVTIGSVDFTFNRFNWIVRGSFDYGHLGDAEKVQLLPGRQTKTSPFNHDPVSKTAIATGIEAGWDLFSQIARLHQDNQKLYLFGRYEYYNSYKASGTQMKFPYTEKNRIAFGLNYYPIKQIVVKGEYSHRFLKSAYNNEPSVSLGVAYEGFFL